MADPIRLLGLAGALRQGSTNRKLVAEAFRAFGEADTAVADIRFPLYDGDLEKESGVPAEVEAFAGQVRWADGIVISTPEYNGNIPGVLKNALDWLSRVKGTPMAGKPVAIMSAADGRSGGARAQHALRLCLAAFRPRIVPAADVAIAASGSAFDEDGRLKDAASFEFLGKLMTALREDIAHERGRTG